MVQFKRNTDAEASGPPVTLDSRLLAAPPLRRLRPGRWVLGALIVLFGVWLLHIAIGNPNFQWDVVGHYLFSPAIVAGVWMTIRLTASAMVIGFVLGWTAALMRMADHPVLVAAATVYVEIFRGVPVLVQLIFWYNVSALFPQVALGMPFIGPDFVHLNVNSIVTPALAANLGLGLCEGAYMSEIVRSGILSVDTGQCEAALALGLTRRQAIWRIVVPQALRVIVPPTGNQVIGMLKYSSLASVISVTELLSASELIYTRTFETIPLLLVCSIWYVVLTAILTIVQRLVERHVGRGYREAGSRRPIRSRFAWRRHKGSRVSQA